MPNFLLQAPDSKHPIGPSAPANYRRHSSAVPLFFRRPTTTALARKIGGCPSGIARAHPIRNVGREIGIGPERPTAKARKNIAATQNGNRGRPEARSGDSIAVVACGTKFLGWPILPSRPPLARIRRPSASALGFQILDPAIPPEHREARPIVANVARRCGRQTRAGPSAPTSLQTKPCRRLLPKLGGTSFLSPPRIYDPRKGRGVDGQFGP